MSAATPVKEPRHVEGPMKHHHQDAMISRSLDMVFDRFDNDSPVQSNHGPRMTFDSFQSSTDKTLPLSATATPFSALSPTKAGMRRNGDAPSSVQSSMQSVFSTGLTGSVNTSLLRTPGDSNQTSNTNGNAGVEPFDTDGNFGAWVRVRNLDPHTRSEDLLDIFFAHCASEAIVAQEATNGRKQGIVFFSNVMLAGVAIEKVNNFIPCNQTRPLVVELLVPKGSANEHVDSQGHHGRHQQAVSGTPPTGTPTRNNAPQSGVCLSQVDTLATMPSTPPAQVASFIQQHADKVKDIASDICESAFSSALKAHKLGDALAAIPPSWPQRNELQATLVRDLLAVLLGDNSHWERRSGAATMLGVLFVKKFVTGDPFVLACRLLRSEIRQRSVVDALVQFAEMCRPVGADEAQQQFWLTMKETSVAHPDSQFRQACASQLAAYEQRKGSMRGKGPVNNGPMLGGMLPAAGMSGGSTLSSHASPFQPTNTSFSGASPSNGQTAQQSAVATESRTRTVYVSKLPPNIPQCELAELLRKCGGVNKVRLCAESGHATLYGFIEMPSVDAARMLVMLDRMEIGGGCVRFQAARSAIQDVEQADAIVGVDGSVIRPCQFGNSAEPIGTGKNFRR